MGNAREFDGLLAGVEKQSGSSRQIDSLELG